MRSIDADPIARFRHVFQEELGAEFPLPIPAAATRVHEDGLLVGVVSDGGCLVVQNDLGRMLSVGDGYFVAGFWGHGVNSYALYYCHVDAGQRVFFRLPYGGAYMDNEAAGRRVVSKLRDYAELAARRSAAGVRRLLAVDWMSAGGTAIEFSDGTYVHQPLGEPGARDGDALTSLLARERAPGPVPERVLHELGLASWWSANSK